VSEAYPALFAEAGDVIETQHLLVPGGVTKRHTRSRRRSERDPDTRTVLDAASATFVAVSGLVGYALVGRYLHLVRSQRA
jgi:hypothetical protein